MAVRFVCDDQADALSAWSVNYPEWVFRHEQERQFWLDQGLSGTPWGVARAAAVTDAAASVSVTLTATSPWTRERQFWQLWADLPPVPLA